MHEDSLQAVPGGCGPREYPVRGDAAFPVFLSEYRKFRTSNADKCVPDRRCLLVSDAHDLREAKCLGASHNFLLLSV